MEFRATLELHGKTATGITVPEEVVDALGSSRRPAVRVTINGYTYRSTVAAYRGVYMLPLSAENREGAGATAGEVLDVRIELDTEPRTVDIPDDLDAALAADPKARAFFDTLSVSNQRAYTTWVDSAKRPETRQDRVARTVALLAEGRKTR
jgi:hypothetical protein